MKNNDEWSNCLTNKREQKKKKNQCIQSKALIITRKWEDIENYK